MESRKEGPFQEMLAHLKIFQKSVQLYTHHHHYHHQVSGLSMLLVAQISKLNLSAYPVWIVCLIVCFMTGLLFVSNARSSLRINMCHLGEA